MATQVRRVLAALLMAVVSASAIAERCGEVDVCVGKVVYVHVPKRQLEVPLLFPEGGLPKVGSTIKLKDWASLIEERTFSDKFWLPRFTENLASVTRNGQTLEWNILLRAGSEVEIISYARFPQLGEMAAEQFVKVLVKSE